MCDGVCVIVHVKRDGQYSGGFWLVGWLFCLFVTPQVGRYGDTEFDFSADRVLKGIDESLQRLGVSYIDLIQCHDIEFVDIKQVVEETIPALLEAKAQGKVKHIGKSLDRTPYVCLIMMMTSLLPC